MVLKACRESSKGMLAEYPELSILVALHFYTRNLVIMHLNRPFVLLLAVSCSSLTSYNDQIADAYDPYIEGDLVTASEAIEELAEEHFDGNNRVVFLLEKGTILRDAGDFKGSFQALEDAEATIKQVYDERMQAVGDVLSEG